MLTSFANYVIHATSPLFTACSWKTERAGRLAHLTEVSFETAQGHPDQHSQIRGEDLE
jgi:hypothetical protein